MQAFKRTCSTKNWDADWAHSAHKEWFINHLSVSFFFNTDSQSAAVARAFQNGADLWWGLVEAFRHELVHMVPLTRGKKDGRCTHFTNATYLFDSRNKTEQPLSSFHTKFLRCHHSPQVLHWQKWAKHNLFKFRKKVVWPWKIFPQIQVCQHMFCLFRYSLCTACESSGRATSLGPARNGLGRHTFPALLWRLDQEFLLADKVGNRLTKRSDFKDKDRSLSYITEWNISVFRSKSKHMYV